MITLEKQAQNYFVVFADGELVAQVMEGGMFGKGNVVIIENYSTCHHVKNAADGDRILKEVIKRACQEAKS